MFYSVLLLLVVSSVVFGEVFDVKKQCMDEKKLSDLGMQDYKTCVKKFISIYFDRAVSDGQLDVEIKMPYAKAADLKVHLEGKTVNDVDQVAFTMPQQIDYPKVMFYKKDKGWEIEEKYKKDFN